MSKLLLYQEPITGVTTNGQQYAFFISEEGLPTIKQGSTVISFGTSGYAYAGSSGSSGNAGTSGVSGTNGISGTSGVDGASGLDGSAGTSGINGTSGVDGSIGATGDNGSSGSSGATGVSGTSGISYGSSGSSGSNGLDGLGAKSKAGSVALTSFTGDPLIYDVVFSENYANTNYSVNTYATGSESQGFGGFYPYITNKTVSGFTINTGLSNPLDPAIDNVVIDWLAISQGETGVAVSGTSGTSGPAGTSGTSSAGGAVDLFGPDFGTTVLHDNITNQYGYAYLYGYFGNAIHWGFDSTRNFEYGWTMPVTVPAGKQLTTVYFPLECDIANTDIPFKFVMWNKKDGTYYPYDYLGHIDHIFNFDSTGYKVVAFDINFPNDGSWGNTDNTFFLSVVANDLDMAMRFRSYVDWYNYDLRGGIFNPSDGTFRGNEVYGLNRVYNTSWFELSGIPSIYGPGPGNGYTMGQTNNPCFYSISTI